MKSTGFITKVAAGSIAILLASSAYSKPAPMDNAEKISHELKYKELMEETQKWINQEQDSFTPEQKRLAKLAAAKYFGFIISMQSKVMFDTTEGKYGKEFKKWVKDQFPAFTKPENKGNPNSPVNFEAGTYNHGNRYAKEFIVKSFQKGIAVTTEAVNDFTELVINEGVDRTSSVYIKQNKFVQPYEQLKKYSNLIVIGEKVDKTWDTRLKMIIMEIGDISIEAGLAIASENILAGANKLYQHQQGSDRTKEIFETAKGFVETDPSNSYDAGVAANNKEKELQRINIYDFNKDPFIYRYTSMVIDDMLTIAKYKVYNLVKKEESHAPHPFCITIDDQGDYRFVYYKYMKPEQYALYIAKLSYEEFTPEYIEQNQNLVVLGEKIYDEATEKRKDRINTAQFYLERYFVDIPVSVVTRMMIDRHLLGETFHDLNDKGEVDTAKGYTEKNSKNQFQTVMNNPYLKLTFPSQISKAANYLKRATMNSLKGLYHKAFPKKMPVGYVVLDGVHHYVYLLKDMKKEVKEEKK